MFIETIRHDRVVVALGLIGVAAVSWLYLLAGAGMDMEPMQHGAMTMHPQIPDWNISYLLVMFAMWWVMMIAMMLPSAAPMILLFAAANTKAARSRSAKVPTSIFAAGYLLVWGGFSLLATLLQWGLSSARLLDTMMQTNSNLLAAGLLIAAGAYQFSPLKTACLRHCRGPVQFISQYWQPGRIGAFKMGLIHGTFCLGCCWFLMALLFYGGVMNLLWIGGLALFVLIEKLAPRADIIGKLMGAVLLIWGISLLWPLIGTAV